MRKQLWVDSEAALSCTSYWLRMGRRMKKFPETCVFRSDALCVLLWNLILPQNPLADMGSHLMPAGQESDGELIEKHDTAGVAEMNDRYQIWVDIQTQNYTSNLQEPWKSRGFPQKCVLQPDEPDVRNLNFSQKEFSHVDKSSQAFLTILDKDVEQKNSQGHVLGSHIEPQYQTRTRFHIDQLRQPVPPKDSVERDVHGDLQEDEQEMYMAGLRDCQSEPPSPYPTPGLAQTS